MGKPTFEIKVDMRQWEKFFKVLKREGEAELQKKFAEWFEAMGFELLRIIQDEIIRLQVVDTRLLLASFHRDADKNVWIVGHGGLTLEVGSNLEYAAWVNDGHYTTKDGVARRFVPGYWQGDRFVYDPGAEGGMMLVHKWVEGAHYWDSAIAIFEKIFPKALEKLMEQWLEELARKARS